MRPPAPKRHLMGEMLRHVAKKRYNELTGAATVPARTRLMSAAGPTAGKCLVAPAGLKQAHFGDSMFTQILQWRLGIKPWRPVTRCCNVKADGDSCEEKLDEDGTHAVTCPCGPLRIQRHDAVTDELSDCIAETGALVRREAWVREFATPSSEAVLDVWAFGVADVADLLVDVTITHPLCASQQPQASTEAGSAAAAAEMRKWQRYPAAGGRMVVPFAVETWGRLGDEAESLLETLAAAASRRANLRGHSCSATGYLKRWRAALDAVAQRGVAMSLTSAYVGLAGRPHKKKTWGLPAPLEH